MLKMRRHANKVFLGFLMWIVSEVSGIFNIRHDSYGKAPG